jgi:hypothetical protein
MYYNHGKSYYTAIYRMEREAIQKAFDSERGTTGGQNLAVARIRPHAISEGGLSGVP